MAGELTLEASFCTTQVTDFPRKEKEGEFFLEEYRAELSINVTSPSAELTERAAQTAWPEFPE